jgi:hypothetical protein
VTSQNNGRADLVLGGAHSTTPQMRLAIMAGPIDWVLTLQQADAAKETSEEGKKRAHRRYADAVAALFGRPGSTGGMQATRGLICIFANEPAASWLLLVRLHHVKNYGRIFGGWLIGIDPSLERINLTARCGRPSWTLRSLQRGRTP